MGATHSFVFDQYRLRPTLAGDLDLAREWTAADRDHASINPAFWLEQTANHDSYLLYDVAGPVFFFKICGCFYGSGELHAEVHIQFAPIDERRLMAGLTRGLQWLESMLSSCGYREVFFDSTNERLIRFCVKRLGFAEERGKLRKRLAA